MKQLISILFVLFLCGCTMFPVKYQFPEPPPTLMESPQSLLLINKEYKSLNESDKSVLKLSDVITTVVKNYNICESNSTQLISLQNWVAEQYNLSNIK